MSSHEEYREWDAAYVLGALSPAERREFERHLAGCETCRAAVAELAGMPAVLSELSGERAARVVSDRPRRHHARRARRRGCRRDAGSR